MKLSKLKLVVAALLAASVMMFVGCSNNNDGELPNGYYYTSDNTTTIYVKGDKVTPIKGLSDEIKISITNASDGDITFRWSYDGDSGIVMGHYDSASQKLTIQSGVVFASTTVFIYNGKAVPIH